LVSSKFVPDFCIFPPHIWGICDRIFLVKMLHKTDMPKYKLELVHAIPQTASRKATGSDEVPAELFKAGGQTVLDRMRRICVAIWETGEWPEEWTFSTFIPLPKKGDLKLCKFRNNCRVSPSHVQARSFFESYYTVSQKSEPPKHFTTATANLHRFK